MSILHLIIWSLASAALGYFLTEHSGPFGFMREFRKLGYAYRDENGECQASKRNPIGQALCCAECASFWIAIGLVIWQQQSINPIDILAVWGGALVIIRWLNG